MALLATLPVLQRVDMSRNVVASVPLKDPQAAFPRLQVGLACTAQHARPCHVLAKPPPSVADTAPGHACTQVLDLSCNCIADAAVVQQLRGLGSGPHVELAGNPIALPRRGPPPRALRRRHTAATMWSMWPSRLFFLDHVTSN